MITEDLFSSERGKPKRASSFGLPSERRKCTVGLFFKELKKEGIEDVIEIISTSMNSNEGRWAKKTINFHFFCKENNFEDGRFYFIALKENKIIGIVGLHHYIWGPDDIVWLGWFAVHKNYQRKGIGTYLMSKVIEAAKSRGFRKIFVETYSGKDFNKARSFYSKFGFKKVGRIKEYIGNDDMIVFGKKI